MYAVIKAGGKQKKVKPGDVIEVKKLVHDGKTLTFQPILVVDDDGKTHVGADAARVTVKARRLSGSSREGRERLEIVDMFFHEADSVEPESRRPIFSYRPAPEVESVEPEGGESGTPIARTEPPESNPRLRNCPDCGSLVDRTKKKCRYCGGKLPPPD